MKALVVITFLFCLSFSLKAEQIAFSTEKSEENYHFRYIWKDHTSTEQTLSFELSKTALFDKYRDFSHYKPEVTSQIITQRLFKQIRQNPIPGVQVKFKPHYRGGGMEIKGRDSEVIQKAQQQIIELETEITDEYFENSYYQRFTTYNQIQGIKPNHVKIANMAVEDLKPLKETILEKVSTQNVRNATNFTLSLIQTIPYSKLESRITSSGAGFNPPLRLLWENQGDCDSKVTLTAALLRVLMPRIEIALIFIEQHALIGINMPPLPGEQSIKVDNITYVLAEPTGPSVLALGKISPSSERAIANGHYIVEKLILP